MQHESNERLLACAVNGDEEAITQLLWDCYDALARHVAQRLPGSLKSKIDVEDILQETLTDAWRAIASFRPQGSHSFFQWVRVIAERNLFDKIKAQRRIKRGGLFTILAGFAQGESSAGNLLTLAAGQQRSPSSCVACDEAKEALLTELKKLRPDYRQALQLRYLEGHSVAAVAQRMGRTPRAVHMLCNRAIKQLEERMGSASEYLAST